MARSVRDRPAEGSGPSWIGKLLSGTVGVAALCAFGVLLFFSYGEGQSSSSGRTPVVIKADPGPFKVKPDSPGGRAVPDRDKRIYDRIAAAPPERTVERLLPPPEVPLPPPKAEPAAAPALPAATPGPESANPKMGSEAKAAKTGTEAAKPLPAPPVAEKYRLQLAALRSKDAVDKAWKRLRKRHRDLLSGLRLAIEKKDLGRSKGVYYRLLAGPVTDRKKARRLCVDLAKRNVECLVVRR